MKCDTSHYASSGRRQKGRALENRICLRVLSGQWSNLQERLSASRIEFSVGFSERSGLMGNHQNIDRRVIVKCIFWDQPQSIFGSNR
jgi:hypothetical protein